MYEVYLDNELVDASSSWEYTTKVYNKYANEGTVTLVKSTTVREIITEDQ